MRSDRDEAPPPVFVRGSLRILGSGLAVPTCPSPEGPREVITAEDMVGLLQPEARSPREAQAIGRMLDHAGCRQRHWSHWIGSPLHPDEPNAADLAVEAARYALDDAGCAMADIQLLILALSTSTLPTIATSTPVASALGYAGPCFDLKAGCAGSLYAMHLASVLLMAGYSRIMVVGSDTMSRYLDRRGLMGFPTVGDGAGALVLGPGTGTNFLSALWGEYSTWDTAGVFGTLPPRAEDLERFTFTGAPTRLKEGIATRLTASLRTLLARGELSATQASRWISHQIAPPILEAVRLELGWSPETVFANFPRYGNTGAASLLMALHEARREGEGAIALSALGGGMRWGAAWWEGWT